MRNLTLLLLPILLFNCKDDESNELPIIESNYEVTTYSTGRTYDLTIYDLKGKELFRKNKLVSKAVTQLSIPENDIKALIVSPHETTYMYIELKRTKGDSTTSRQECNFCDSILIYNKIIKKK